MTFLMIKSILATVFLAAGLAAMLAMLTLMGKSERSVGAGALRRAHRIAGWAFVVLMIVISYMCIRYLAAAGDGIPSRAVMHSALASLLIVVVLLKILIVRVYKNFARFAPVMGLIVFSTAFVVFSTSAGFYLVRTWCPVSGETAAAPEASQSIEDAGEMMLSETSDEAFAGDKAVGGELFGLHCAGCHYADRETSRIGPGLEGLLTSDGLPSGRPATVENVRSQIIDPAGTMPSFATLLSAEEMDHLLAYLQTL